MSKLQTVIRILSVLLALLLLFVDFPLLYTGYIEILSDAINILMG